MSFGLMTPREYIENAHGRLHDAATQHLKGDVTAVSVVSIHDEAAGQMILCDTRADKKKVAARLRLAADVLDPAFKDDPSIDTVPSALRARGLNDIADEWELMQEVLAFYANDEDRTLAEEGEPYGSIPTEVGMKARQHRKVFQKREQEPA